MGRKTTGNVEVRNGRPYAIRVSMPDGGPPVRFRIKPEWSPEMIEAKREYYVEAVVSGRVERDPETKAATVMPATVKGEETFAAWSERWLGHREARGMSSVATDRSRLKLHVLDVLGRKPMATVTREDVGALVARLDEKIADGRIEWKTAHNAWGTVTRMFRDASRSKVAALRCRDDNPTREVEGPDRGAKKAKSYLYPNEVSALLSCSSIPIRWRQLYAIAVYTYARAGELAALTWHDVDLEGGVIHIHRAEDRSKGTIKTTKELGTRRVPIEPALVPLLEALRPDTDEEPSAAGLRIVNIPESGIAAMLRRHLLKAGVTRDELHTGDVARKPLTFHDLRATGITFLALRGDEPLAIMRRAGHTDFKTTSLYVREAEVLGASVGAPFPTLPPALFLPPITATGSVSGGKQAQKRSHLGDLNPGDGQKPAEKGTSRGSLPPLPEGPKSAIAGRVAETVAVISDPLEAALIGALRVATEAGDLEKIAAIVAEVKAVREARGGGNVVALDQARRRGRS
jgi:integrase